MRLARTLALTAVAALCAGHAYAQTADEIVEKHLTAIGGRAALGKLDSRISTGTIALSVQGMELGGTVEIYNKAPNKSRTYFKIDLSQVGAGEMIVDQRCDGKTAFASNSMQGDQEITGKQLASLLNATFPSPWLKYKEAGTTIELIGKEKLGERNVYVLQSTPKAGSPSKSYVDADTFLVLRTVVKADVPQLGGEVEQTSDLSDYRDVDGVKVPFKVNVVSSVQTVTVMLAKVEHNKPIDEAMFSRPAAK